MAHERRIVGGTLAVVCVWRLLFGGVFVVQQALAFNDFGTFYRATASSHLYGPDPLITTVGPATFINLNPPHFHLAFRPLTWLPIEVAYWVWMILTAAAIGWSLLPSRRVGPTEWPWWFWIVILIWSPCFALLYTGQITALILVPLTLAWRADREGRHAEAGAWLGLAGSVKPHLVLLIAWHVYRRGWSAAAAAIIAALAACVAGAVVYGPTSYGAWVNQLRQATWAWPALNASIWAIPARALQSTPYYEPITVAPGWTPQLVGAVLGLLILTRTAWVLRRTPDTDRGWALSLSTIFLAVPLGWVYYVWWLVPVIRRVRLPLWAWIAFAVGMSLPPGPIVTYVAGHSAIATVTIGSALSYGMLALWIGLQCKKTQPA